MKFTIDRDELIKGLDRMITHTNNIVPILNTLLMSVDDQVLTIVSTDSIKTSVVRIKIKDTEMGGVCVPIDKFANLIRKMPKGELKLGVDKTFLKIEQSKIKAKVKTLDPDEFPIGDDVAIDVSLKIDSEELYDMLRLTSLCLGVSIGFNINGMVFDIGKKLSLLATDGKRLARIDNGENPKNQYVVPQRSVEDLLKIIRNKDEKIEIISSNKQILFRFSDGYYSSLLLAEKYPDCNKLIPQPKEKKLKINREELILTLKRANLLTQSKKTDDPIKLELSKNKLVVSKIDPQFGEIEETLSVGYDDKDVTIGFNAQYLIDILQILSSDVVFFEIYGANKPVVVRDDNYVYLALPIAL